ncbi:MAG: mannose-1-phosphate guanylyltransferase [Gammaproteobacteria bacterium]|nr:MAG: mannose-1-phosphate guanylyltransferase [Gammaproteobacteria bacterium]
MKAMILAAGRGKRMGVLTDKMPKPLLKIAGKFLIVHQIERLRDNGFFDIVVNVGYLGKQIIAALGDGEQYGVRLKYSIEPQEGLETGGGVFQALPLLGASPFLLTNADVFCNYPYALLQQQRPDSVHLVLVDTPEFKQKGDFSLAGDGSLLCEGDTLTFSGISVINPIIFARCQPGFYPIAPLFKQAIESGTATAEYYQGQWQDVGTPERLKALQSSIR